MLQKIQHCPMETLRPVLLLPLVLVLSACVGLPAAPSTAAHEVPFEVVDRSDYYSYTGNTWQVHAPGLAVIAEPSDVEQLDAFITPDSQAKLRALDYDTHFALAAFLDVQGCYEMDWGVEEVLLREDELEVHATYPQYDPQQGCALDFLFPYHIIQLQREDVWNEVTGFTLYLNDEHAVTGPYPPVVSQATPAPTPTRSFTPVPTPTQTPGPTLTPSPP
ncbi:MAG: hypothetical protein ACOC9X_04095 [bacterium]